MAERGNIAFCFPNVFEFRGENLSDEHIGLILNFLLRAQAVTDIAVNREDWMELGQINRELDAEEAATVSEPLPTHVEKQANPALVIPEHLTTDPGSVTEDTEELSGSPFMASPESRARQMGFRVGDERSSISIGEIVGDKLRKLAEQATAATTPAESAVPEEPAADTVEEATDSEAPQPVYFKTGIKLKTIGDNPQLVPHYKLKYWCPDTACATSIQKRSGTHYVPLGTAYVRCFHCKRKLQVIPATNHGFGVSESHRDSFGNFMIARDLYYG